ncbi:MAG TPA: LamG domain-containing protein [Chitinophagaceae bacterium]|jgi:hypothetical protein|nr:LamG domain-containing protein [Chitinophagaceae bacterium]
MKKQILFMAVTISAILFSCSKEKIETPPATETAGMESVAKMSPGLVINTLNIGLLGRYEFDGNLKDTTGKLEDGWPTVSRVVVPYTADRKGQANKAILFKGTYGVDLYDIPYTPSNCSVSFWVKDNVIEGPYWTEMLGSSHAFNFIQNENEFNGNFQKFGYGIVQQIGTTPINSNWHHIAATRDNTSMKLYIDGVLIGTAPSPVVDFGSWVLHNYRLGYGGGSYWKGAIDDLRFYKRVLTASEVTQLYNS